MKYLCVLFALSILVSAVYAAPTKSENQKSVKLQRWWQPIVKHLGPMAVDYLHNYHGSEKSFQEKSVGEVQDIDKYLSALEGALHGYLNPTGAVEMQRLPWGTIITTLGPLLADQIHGHGTAESSKDDVAAEVEGADKYMAALLDAFLKHNGAAEVQRWSKLPGTLGSVIYDYLSNHQSLLKKLEEVALEQDGDIMAAIENLPEKEKAQAQLLGTLSALLTAGSLAHDLING